MDKNFVTIGVNSLDNSIAFYKDILGFTVEKRFQPANEIELAFLVNADGFKIELVDRKDMEKIDYSQAPLTLSFMTDDLDGIQQLLGKHSVTCVRFPLPTGIEILRLTDPDGLGIAFLKNK